MTWAVRIDLASDKIPATTGRAAPIVYWPGELSILLHSGERRFFSLGAEDPASEIWYAGYLPANEDPDIDRAIELVAGGDLAQLRDISISITNQMEDEQLMTSWIRDEFDGLSLDGATIRVYAVGPSESNPEPTPDWTGIVRSARPLGTRIRMRCEPQTLADQIGDDVGGGKIYPIVYGRGLKVKLPQLVSTDYPIAPMDNPGLFGSSERKKVYALAVIGVPSTYHIDLACYWPEMIRAEIPEGPVSSSDWFVEIVAGAGKGECRRITAGAELVHSSSLPGYPVLDPPPGYPLDWWRIPIDEPFVDPDTRASLLDLVVSSGSFANLNRSVVRIVRRSIEFAAPAHLSADAVISGASETYVKSGDKYVRAQNYDKIWEPGDTPGILRAIASPFKSNSWAIFQHLLPNDGQFVYTFNGAGYGGLTQAEVLEKLNDDATDLIEVVPSGSSPPSVTFRLLAKHIPFGLGLQRVWAAVYVETDSASCQIELEAFGRHQYLPLLRVPSPGAGNRDTNPPWFSPWPGVTTWRSTTPRLYNFGGNEAAVEEITVQIIGAAHAYFRLGQLSLIAELELPIGTVYADIDGPSYDGSGNTRVKEIWETRLASVSSTAAPTPTTMIEDHVHLIEDLFYRHLRRDGNSIDIASAEQAYLDLMAKTQPGLSLPSLATRPKANLMVTRSTPAADVISQLCRDGMIAGDFDGNHRLVLHAWLARTGLPEQDATILPEHIDRSSFQGFADTELSKLVTAPLIRYAVEDEIPTRAIQIIRPDASTFDPSYAIGFEDPADGERAWEICHAAYLRTKLVHVRELVFATVPDYASIKALTLQPRGTTFLRWIAETKDQTQGLTIPSDHPAASQVLGSRIKLTDTLYCPEGRWGTLAANPLRISAARCAVTLLMDPAS